MIDEHAVTDLLLYIDNDHELYHRQAALIKLSLLRKYTKGTYDHNLAAKAFLYLTTSGAKKYAKEFHPGQIWHHVFPMALRREVAQRMADDNLEELEYEA